MKQNNKNVSLGVFDKGLFLFLPRAELKVNHSDCIRIPELHMLRNCPVNYYENDLQVLMIISSANNYKKGKYALLLRLLHEIPLRMQWIFHNSAKYEIQTMGQHHNMGGTYQQDENQIVYGDPHATSGVFLQNAVTNHSEQQNFYHLQQPSQCHFSQWLSEKLLKQTFSFGRK